MNKSVPGEGVLLFRSGALYFMSQGTTAYAMNEHDLLLLQSDSVCFGW